MDCAPARRIQLREAAQGTGEVPDPTPVEFDAGAEPLTLREEMRRFIKQELSNQAEHSGMESFEEADDFEVDEPDIFTTEHTVIELKDEEGRPDDLEGAPNQEDKEHEGAPDADEPAKPTHQEGKPVGGEENPDTPPQED